MENTPTQNNAAAAVAPQGSERPTLRLTERAVTQVKSIIEAQGFEGHYLVVRVVPAGCNGFGYDLNLVKDHRPDDLVWEQDGVKIATDPMSVQYLNGTEVDFASGLQGAGFKFQNPNARSSCGCGTSFNV
jgi:iron-sulfur cluster assembly protein